MDAFLSNAMANLAVEGGLEQVVLWLYPLIVLGLLSAILVLVLTPISRRLETIVWTRIGRETIGPFRGQFLQRIAFTGFAMGFLLQGPEVNFTLRIQRWAVLIGVTLILIGALVGSRSVRAHGEAGKAGEGAGTWLAVFGVAVIVIGVGSCLVTSDCFLPGRGLGLIDALTSDFPQH